MPNFDAHFVENLRPDPNQSTGIRQVRGAHYSLVTPSPLKSPKLLALTASLAQDLGLDPNQDWTQLLSGQLQAPGMQPYAMCYGGHQFGHWAGQLGDGRAINLGERVDAQGVRQTLQLKGAGPTPYSRSADGLAVLRSSVREYLCSEAMFHLGVPTTRALSLALSGDEVMRDMFYDGRAAYEPGAIVCRVAPSFVRFGSFEIFAAREELEPMRELADYVIREHYPHLWSEVPDPQMYVLWFQEVCQRTAEMIVHWSRVGFVHGVMNTDNLSILGLTIDYGPYGWLENYDPGWTPNTTDAEGRRYAFGQQSHIGQWNLLKLANAIVPLAQDVEALQDALKSYSEIYDRGWEGMFAAKLGWGEWNETSDAPLVTELLEIFTADETDWTLFFRGLSELDLNDPAFDVAAASVFSEALYRPELTDSGHLQRQARWMRLYTERGRTAALTAAKRSTLMRQTNPKYVLRNYLAQLAIEDATQGDLGRLHELERVLTRPYDDQPEAEHLAAKRPEWARTKPGCSTLSCSS